MQKHNSILISLFLLFVLNFSLCFAQINPSTEPTASKKNTAAEILSSDKIVSYAKGESLLLPYMLCLATVKDSVSLCDKLPPQDAKLCKHHFIFLYQFYTPLIINKTITSNLIDAYAKIEERSNPAEARGYMENFLRGNDSICVGNGCRAIVKQDPNLCASNDHDCLGFIAYFQALKSSDINQCDLIKDEAIRMLCKGRFSKDEKTCRKCESFNEFVERYFPVR